MKQLQSPFITKNTENIETSSKCKEPKCKEPRSHDSGSKGPQNKEANKPELISETKDAVLITATSANIQKLEETTLDPNISEKIMDTDIENYK